MLLWLTGQLAGYESLFGVFRYLTLRAILSVLTALAIALLAGPWVIDRLAGLQIKQSIRTLGPATHLSKAGMFLTVLQDRGTLIEVDWPAIIRIHETEFPQLCALVTIRNPWCSDFDQ